MSDHETLSGVECPRCHRHVPTVCPDDDGVVVLARHDNRNNSGFCTASLTRAFPPDDCWHDSSSGVDQTPLDDPAKVWLCHECGAEWSRLRRQWRAVKRVALAAALVAATCNPNTPPEPFNAAADTTKLDYPQPHTIEDATHYALPPRPKRTRPSRSRPRPPARTTTPTATGDTWAALAQCESGNNPTRHSASGTYHGAFQFSLATWRGVGESGDPHTHPYSTQLDAAQRLQARSGWGSWPACARKLGLR